MAHLLSHNSSMPPFPCLCPSHVQALPPLSFFVRLACHLCPSHGQALSHLSNREQSRLHPRSAAGTLAFARPCNLILAVFVHLISHVCPSLSHRLPMSLFYAQHDRLVFVEPARREEKYHATTEPFCGRLEDYPRRMYGTLITAGLVRSHSSHREGSQ